MIYLPYTEVSLAYRLGSMPFRYMTKNNDWGHMSLDETTLSEVDVRRWAGTRKQRICYCSVGKWQNPAQNLLNATVSL